MSVSLKFKEIKLNSFSPKAISHCIIIFLLLSFSIKSFAQDKQAEKITSAIQVLKDFGSMKESIPHELLEMSEGIIIVPKMINAGFVIAGKRGRGIAMVKNEDGNWSNPVFITITGGSVGFQAGIQSIDLVLIFKHRQTLEDIGKRTFTLGGDISATAGPVGRNSTATTDYKMEAEVYSYSRSKGLFAGISLTGAALSVHENANTSFYGENKTAAAIFKSSNSAGENIVALKKELSSLYQ